jgi:serine/threonine-protein kinase RsbW
MRAVGSEGASSLDRLDRTRVTVAVGPLVGPVLSRVVGIHAARAELPVDRLNDAVLVADAVAARAPAFAVGDRLPVSVQSGPGRLEVRIGPLRPGGGARVLEGAALPDVGSVIERLADNVRVRGGAGGDEYLVIRIELDPDTPDLAPTA